MISDILPNPMHTRRFYLVLGFVIVLAWSLLAIWQGSEYADLLGHESIEDHHFPIAWQLTAFLLNWFLMTVAMMLPGNLPMFIQFVQPARPRLKNLRFVGLIILGYLAPWVLFGLLIYLGDIFLHKMSEPTAPLAAFSDLIAPMIMLTAGLYQFTPVKRHFMTGYLTPHDLMLQSYGEKMSGARAMKQGLRMGVFCVGTCWSLMLLMFALGHHRLDWMLALGGILAAERLAPWGHRLAWFVGLVLVVWATFSMLASL